MGRSFLRRYAKKLFFLAVVVVLVLNAFTAFTQYRSWQTDPVAKFLIPPYQDINYFAFYAFTRFFAPYFFSLVTALLFLLIALRVNQKKGEIFFEREEPFLGAFSFFVVGHPGWLVYLVVLILAYFMLHASYFILQRRIVRLPLYRLWVPVAFFVILLDEYWFETMNWWQLLAI